MIDIDSITISSNSKTNKDRRSLYTRNEFFSEPIKYDVDIENKVVYFKHVDIDDSRNVIRPSKLGSGFIFTAYIDFSLKNGNYSFDEDSNEDVMIIDLIN